METEIRTAPTVTAPATPLAPDPEQNRERSMKLPWFSLLSLSWLLTGCLAPADDDDSGPTDDDDSVGCAVDASGGTGGATGSSWVTVSGWSTDDATNSPDYEVLVYRPATLSGPAPLAILTANPVPADRGQIEQITYEFIGSGLDAWAEAHDYVFAFPVGGGNSGDDLAFSPGEDDAYMGSAIDAIAGSFDIDRNSIHLFGRSGGGRLAIQLSQAHSTRIASIMSLAGPQPFPDWESGTPEWERPVDGLFIHDENDPVVGRATVLDTVTMFESLGAEVETFFDYTGGHDWDADQVEPRMASFFDRTCL